MKKGMATLAMALMIFIVSISTANAAVDKMEIVNGKLYITYLADAEEIGMKANFRIIARTATGIRYFNQDSAIWQSKACSKYASNFNLELVIDVSKLDGPATIELTIWSGTKYQIYYLTAYMAGYFWRVVIDNENWVWQWDDLFFILIPEIAMIALDRQSILCSEVDCAGGKSNTTTTVPDGSTTTTTITPTTTIPPNKVCGEFVDTWINWQNSTHYSRSIKFEGKYALKGQIPIDDDFTNNGWDYLEPYLSDHPGNQFMSVSFNAGEGTVTYTIVSLNGKYFDASAYLRDTYCQYCMPVFPDPFDLNPDPPCSNARQYLIQEDPYNVCTRHWRFLAP